MQGDGKPQAEHQHELLSLLKTRVTQVFGRNHQFGGGHVFTPSVDVPDDYAAGPRLVVPPTNGAYSRSETNQAFAAAEEILRNRGDQPRRKQNRLTFPVPDDDVVSRLKEQGRIFPARQSIAAWMVGPGFLTSPVSAGDSRFPRGMPAAAAASAFTRRHPGPISSRWLRHLQLPAQLA